METLIVIGGGAAGLAAGCYAQMNGYQTTILEMNDTPGGLCTSWRRGGYTFDGSVAGLAGSAPGCSLYRLWEEIGVAKYCGLHYGENFGSIHGTDGRVTMVYTDIDKLEAQLTEQFPADSRVVRTFIRALRSCVDIEIPFNDAQGPAAIRQLVGTVLNYLPHLPLLLKYGTSTIGQFAAKCTDPALGTVIRNMAHFGGPDVPLLTILLPLAYAHRKLVGIPVHGWLSFARSIERRFLELGGSIRYGARAAKLLTRNGAVQGVALEDGTQILSGRVLSAIDERFLYKTLLGDFFTPEKKVFDPQKVSDQPVQVNIGVNEDFSAEKGPATYILPEKISCAGREHGRITVHNKYFDPEAAPEGRSALTAFIDSDYEWWQQFYSDPVRYKEEKDRCAAMVIGIIGRYHPGFEKKIEVTDVSTPLTRERYSGNWMGAMQAWKPDSHMTGILLQNKDKYIVKGLKGLYKAGHWVEAWGGITTAAQSGRKAIQTMCKIDFRKFIATKA